MGRGLKIEDFLPKSGNMAFMLIFKGVEFTAQ